jgi:hypothetical protein
MRAARVPAVEEWRARWRLRGYAALDDDAHENELVVVTGVVRPLEDTLVAPLSGRTCVAYRSRAQTRFWPRIEHETMQLRPFVLDLGDEEIVVDGQRAIFGLARLRLPRDPERELRFLARYTLERVATFAEVALEPGAHVTIGGTLVLVPRDEPPADELGFRDPPPPSQRIVGNRQRPLVLVAGGA